MRPGTGRPSRGRRAAAWILAAWAGTLAGCVATARLETVDQGWAAVFARDRAVEAGSDDRAAFLAGLLARTRDPYAAPYPAWVAAQRRIGADHLRVRADLGRAAAWEARFRTFVKGRPAVLTARSRYWSGYLDLEAGARALEGRLRRDLDAMGRDTRAFDALARAGGAYHLGPQALGPTLDGIDASMDSGLAAMEDRVARARTAFGLRENSGEDPALLAGQRAALERMEAYLFRSGELARKARLLSRDIRASARTPDGLWTGPGLPDDGSRYARLLGDRAAFVRRGKGFAALEAAFNALLNDEQESIPVR